MNKKQTTFLSVIGAVVVFSIVAIGGFHIMNQREQYVLWCVDNNGIETPHIFYGFYKEDINAIYWCRHLQLNPVRYYVTPIIT